MRTNAFALVGFLAGATMATAGAFHRGRRLRAELAAARHHAAHDALTGLPNRAGFAAHTAGLTSPAVVALLDLNAFKPINDTLGHEIGDAVLVAVADRLRQVLTRHGVVARLGGDEFVAVLTGLPRSNVEGWARWLLGEAARAVAAPLPLAGRVVTVGVSIGAAPHAPTDEMARSLHRADTAMYEAKRRGEPVALFDAAHDTDERPGRAPVRRRDTAAPAARMWRLVA